MSENKTQTELTGALEDYLETIYELVRDRKLARVKDIAKARGVKSGSVSPAMRRLSDLGYIKYYEREFIDLTPEGEQAARRVFARHQLLKRFFTEILRMSSKAALEDACSMEHSLSDEGMDHLVRFFEFLEGCPEGRKLLDRFRTCSLVHSDGPTCELKCPRKGGLRAKTGSEAKVLWHIPPGHKVRVLQISDSSEARQDLLNKGIMAGVHLDILAVDPAGNEMRIRSQGFEMTLNKVEAEAANVIIAE